MLRIDLRQVYRMRACPLKPGHAVQYRGISELMLLVTGCFQVAPSSHPLMEAREPAGDFTLSGVAEAEAMANAGEDVQFSGDAGLLHRKIQLRQTLRDVLA